MATNVNYGSDGITEALTGKAKRTVAAFHDCR